MVDVLCWVHSYHNPLLVRCGTRLLTGARPFHFQECWNRHLVYHPLVHRAWNEEVRGVSFKPERVKEESMIFNREVFGNTFSKKRLLNAKRCGIQKQIEVTPCLIFFNSRSNSKMTILLSLTRRKCCDSRSL